MARTFMKIDGIPGGSQVSGYEDWIELDSMHLGVDRNIAMTIGTGSNREASLPGLSHVTVTKLVNQASNKLFAVSCGSKKSLGTVQVHLCANGPDYKPFMKYNFENAMAASHHQAMSGHGMPSEVFAIAYTKVTQSYVDNNSPVITGYDLTTAKTI